jgi:hypothetical protein
MFPPYIANVFRLACHDHMVTFFLKLYDFLCLKKLLFKNPFICFFNNVFHRCWYCWAFNEPTFLFCVFNFFILFIVGFLFIIKSFVIHSCLKVLRQIIAFYSGKISSWIDLDSEDETVRLDSETTLRQELAWASHLSLQVFFCITQLKELSIFFMLLYHYS